MRKIQQTKIDKEINGNEFSGSISDIEFGVDENHIFVTLYNYGVEVYSTLTMVAKLGRKRR